MSIWKTKKDMGKYNNQFNYREIGTSRWNCFRIMYNGRFCTSGAEILDSVSKYGYGTYKNNLCGLVVRVSGYRSRCPGFESRSY
jgi:hypothetical protein